jgi:hypothetical protein
MNHAVRPNKAELSKTRSPEEGRITERDAIAIVAWDPQEKRLTRRV